MGRMNCSNPHCPNDQLPQLREDENEAEERWAEETRQPYAIVVVHDRECLSKRIVGIAILIPGFGNGWLAIDMNGEFLVSKNCKRLEADQQATEILMGNCGGNCGVLRQRVSKTMNAAYMD